jgi:hypothetical protein
MVVDLRTFHIKVSGCYPLNPIKRLVSVKTKPQHVNQFIDTSSPGEDALDIVTVSATELRLSGCLIGRLTGKRKPLSREIIWQESSDCVHGLGGVFRSGLGYHELGNLPDPSDVLFTIIMAEPQVSVQAMPNVIAVQQHGQPALPRQSMLQSDCYCALP